MAVYRKAIRILIQHTGRVCNAVSLRRLNMTIPEGRPLRHDRNHGGFWVELQDEDGGVLYWETMWRPFMQTIEVPAVDGRLRHVVAPKAPGMFDVLVPDLARAHKIALYSGPIDLDHETNVAELVFAADLQTITEVF